MTRKYIKENNIIEQYLLNKISDEERKAFRVALLFDETLRQEVEDTRFLYQQIKQLKPQDSSASIDNGNPKKNKWLISLFVLGALFIGFFIYTNFIKKEVEVKLPIEETSIKEEILKENNEPQKESVKEKMQSIEGKINDTTPVTPEKVDLPIDLNQPIAAADVESHPYLDQFTNGAYRNSKDKLEISMPTANKVLKLKNGKVQINLKGKLFIETMPEKERFVIRLFSNKKEDFDNFKPILSLSPSIEKRNDHYELNSVSIVPLKEGLYYFIIEDNEIEDMIYVGKFQVVK